MSNLLIINPGGLSTKIAYFKDSEIVHNETINHDIADLEMFKSSKDQLDFRMMTIGDLMHKWGISMEDVDAVVGRGAPLRSLPAGCYEVDQQMISDINSGNILTDHPSLLGALLAKKLTAATDKPAYIVDPVCVDELRDIARISGVKDIKRVSLWHALNSRYVAKKAARKHGLNYEESRLVVAHLGSGISISAHVNGKAVDVNNANDMGPFSPQRAGALPVCGLAKLCFEEGATKEGVLSLLTKKGGLTDYLGTGDLRKIEEMVRQGDENAGLILDSMVYQIAKEIGAMNVACGMAQLIVISGSMSYSQMLLDKLNVWIKNIAPIEIIPGEMEMQALAESALEVMSGKARAMSYKDTK